MLFPPLSYEGKEEGRSKTWKERAERQPEAGERVMIKPQEHRGGGRQIDEEG